MLKINWIDCKLYGAEIFALEISTLSLKNLKTREATESLSIASCAKLILEEKQRV